MYSYLNELTLYAGVLYTQPSWCSFSSWPHSEITSLGRSVTCTRLFLQQRCFWDRIYSDMNELDGGGWTLVWQHSYTEDRSQHDIL